MNLEELARLLMRNLDSKKLEGNEIILTAVLNEKPYLRNLEGKVDGHEVKLEIREWKNRTLDGNTIPVYQLRLILQVPEDFIERYREDENKLYNTVLTILRELQGMYFE